MGRAQTRFGSGVLVSAGFVDGLLSGSDLPLELSSGRRELPRPPHLRAAGVDGLCSLMGQGREALPGVDAFGRLRSLRARSGPSERNGTAASIVAICR
jgi:hypothetical protein